MVQQLQRQTLPEAVAAGVILPDAYTDEARLHETFDWVRSHAPLALAKAPGFDPVWFVSRYADIRTVESDPRRYSSAQHNPILGDQQNEGFLAEMTGGTYRTLSTLTFMDPPEHTGVKAVSAEWFTPQKLKGLEQQIRAHARAAVDELLSFDGECDFVKDFALLYPLRVIMTLLGVPREHEALMLKLTQEFFGTSDPEEQRSELSGDPVAAAKQWNSTIADLFDFFGRLTAARRDEPCDDLISTIANYREDGAYLSDEVINGYYVAIATAGHDTTSSSLAGGVHALIDHPQQYALARAAGADMAGLVAESIRWTSPVKHFMRVATEDAELSGQQILAGDRFFLSYPCANRDEQVFPHAAVFDITRRPNPHIGFGFGPHLCLGQRLARLEMEILFAELIPNLRHIELAGPVIRTKTNFVGGIKSMPVRFTKQ